MGYIAPVTNFQYADYQKRVITDERDPIYIERPFKVVLETQYEEVYDTEKLMEEERKLERIEDFNPHTFGNHQPRAYNRAAAAVTGKGQLFSEMV